MTEWEWDQFRKEGARGAFNVCSPAGSLATGFFVMILANQVGRNSKGQIITGHGGKPYMVSCHWMRTNGYWREALDLWDDLREHYGDKTY